MHKNFCILPFIHLATTTEGTCRLCCKVSKHDVILDDNGVPYNVNTHSIDEIWNSDHYNEIRSRVLADEQLPECATCWREEEIFSSDWSKYRKDELPSKRRKENQKWLHKPRTKLNKQWEDIIDNPRIRYFDIRLSNLCNLKCRMCWPHFSSQIVKEQQHFASKGMPTHYTRYDVAEWDTDSLWKGISDNIIHIEEISFVGGEPTLHDEIYDLCDRMIQLDIAKNIRLKVTTNLTNIQPRFLELFKHFKNIIINGSIDAVGPVNDYIRHPSDWETIDRNIDTLLGMRELAHFNLTLTPVIQIYNIFNIGDITRWFVNKWINLEYSFFEKTNFFTMELDLLYDPSYLSVNRLTPQGKEQWYYEQFMPICEWLDDIIQNVVQRPQHITDNWYILIELRKKVVNIAIYMQVLTYGPDGKLIPTYDSPDIEHNPELAKKLHKYTKQLDQHRGQNILDIIPNFYEIT